MLLGFVHWEGTKSEEFLVLPDECTLETGTISKVQFPQQNVFASKRGPHS